MRFARWSAILFALLYALMPLWVRAATIYLEPDAGTYGPGDTFIVNVRLNTRDVCYNAADITLSYPADAMRAVDFSKGDSIFPLFIGDPQLDTVHGTVRFQGGVPGGYCGRINGDPSLSNILGKVIFTVTSAAGKEAKIDVSPLSMLYLNDGKGTSEKPQTQSATIMLSPTRTTSEDVWDKAVKDDTIPPEPFTIDVESTRGIFSGRYYIVFTTVDKQSGMDHYEIIEGGVWKPVKSPYQLPDQSLKGGIQVRAVDKAGNIRVGTYIEGSAPPRQYSVGQIIGYGLVAIIVLLIIVMELRRIRRRARAAETIVGS